MFKNNANGSRARDHGKFRGEQDVPCASHPINPSARRNHEFETQNKNCKQNENKAQYSHNPPQTMFCACVINCFLSLKMCRKNE